MATMDRVQLTPDMTVEQAMAYVQAGKVPFEDYARWQAAREARLVSEASSKKGAGRKTVPTGLTRAAFRSDAGPIEIRIAGQQLTADAKEFSTHSLGWYLNGKTVLEVAGQKVTVQIGCTLTIVGSKELPL
jgi:hypothetical protein